VGRSHRPHDAGVEETRESSEHYGRGRRGASVEETGPNHPDGMGNRAEGSGPNTGAGSGASAGGV
jgi:hypothetical protein